MASAPLNWLLKIGGATLKTTAKTLSEAVNTLHDTVTNLSTTKADASATTTALNNLETSKLNISDLLSLEEIEASTSLTGKGVTAESIKTLNNRLGGCSLEQEGNDFYIIGTDSVKKKLGSSIQYLGVGKTFNLLSLAPDVDYTSLTTDNFIVVPVSISSSKAASFNGSVFDNSTYLGCEMIAHTFSSKKTYNSQTGVLTISSDSIQGKAYLNGTGFTHTTTASVNFGVYLVS